MSRHPGDLPFNCIGGALVRVPLVLRPTRGASVGLTEWTSDPDRRVLRLVSFAVWLGEGAAGESLLLELTLGSGADVLLPLLGRQRRVAPGCTDLTDRARYYNVDLLDLDGPAALAVLAAVPRLANYPIMVAPNTVRLLRQSSSADEAMGAGVVRVEVLCEVLRP